MKGVRGRHYVACGYGLTMHVLRTRTLPTDRASRGNTLCGRDATGAKWYLVRASHDRRPVCMDCARYLGSTADVDETNLPRGNA